MRVAHGFTHLMVSRPVRTIGDEINLPAGTLPHKCLPFYAHQFKEQHVLQQTSGITYLVEAQHTTDTQIRGIIHTFLP